MWNVSDPRFLECSCVVFLSWVSWILEGFDVFLGGFRVVKMTCVSFG